jgi:hypothetical protein
MSATANKTALLGKPSIAVVSASAVVALVVVGMLINEPVGPAIEVHGTLEGNCVPRGRQSNIFECTAKLTDGSYQIFRELQPLRGGITVTFMRRDRKYMGRQYRLVNVAP